MDDQSLSPFGFSFDDSQALFHFARTADQLLADQPPDPSDLAYQNLQQPLYSHQYEHEHPGLGSQTLQQQQQPSYRAEEAVSSLLRAGEATRKRQKFQRSRLGCLTCKARKLKCDERTPVCGRCTTAKRECRWADGQAAAASSGSPSNVGGSTSTKRRPSASLDDGLQPVASSSRVTLDGPLPPQPSSALGKQLFSQAHDSRRPKRTGTGEGRGGVPIFVDLVPPDAKLAIMTSPSFLHPYFPTTEEKMLIHQYFHCTTRIIVARDSEINFWVTKHGPLAFSVAKGYSPACDALRDSLLLVAAVHLRYLSPNAVGDPTYIQRLRHRTVDQIKKVIAEGEQGEDELILCALLSCAVSCSLGGDGGWQELLQLASQVVQRNGGPQALLERAPRDRMSAIRFVVEQLATREVFGSLTTGTTPSLLGEGFAPWFFEMEKWSASEEERASIEIMFGLSRGMVDLIARVATVVAKKHATGFLVFEDDDQEPSPSDSMTDQLPSNPTDVETERARSSLELEARNLVLELGIWSTREDFSPIHPRVQFGNSASRLAMNLFLLTNVFLVDRSDPRITEGAKGIIEVIKGAAAMFSTLIWLTWPTLISGLNCASEQREDIRTLMAGFGEHAAFDNLWAITVLNESWRRQDEGQSPSLREIIDALGLEPFFD